MTSGRTGLHQIGGMPPMRVMRETNPGRLGDGLSAAPRWIVVCLGAYLTADLFCALPVERRRPGFLRYKVPPTALRPCR